DPRFRRLGWTALDEVSPALPAAVIASEDRRFYHHRGVDLAALAAAFVHRLNGGRSRGASTITMQVAAMLDSRLARDGTRRSAIQKVRQILAALILDQRWSKREILETYINVVTWRGELEGIGAASRVMFGKVPQGVDSAEAAVLAASIKA